MIAQASSPIMNCIHQLAGSFLHGQSHTSYLDDGSMPTRPAYKYQSAYTVVEDSMCEKHTPN